MPCHWPAKSNAKACTACRELKVRCSKSSNPPRGKKDEKGKGKGKAAPPIIAAPSHPPPPFIFDAHSIRDAQAVIANHSAGLRQTTKEIEKKKAKYDASVTQLFGNLEAIMGELAKSAQ
ncbi:hypothetical protein BD410DRAFT_846353 [Rickenella mellea]|uniref:Uncharacterized protein n=1 Tax=Rickenella mellea TaxID=50990 RepID=A0A4Y7PGE3_9AGAM|nr:hypothetical protein BD410DRAFT_846353 [Rickenella mellea]